MNVSSIFYVYEHWRPDTSACFYVGKGHGDRAYSFRRNNHYNRIVNKLARLGMAPEVRIVKAELDESTALSIEIDRIAYWRNRGNVLANITDGGEGVSGLKHTEETRAKIREKRANQKVICSQEAREKIGRAQRGKPKSDTQKLKQSLAMTGRKMPEVTRSAIHAANTGSHRSLESRERMSAWQRGLIRPESFREMRRAMMTGKKASEKTREKMSESQRARWARLKAEGSSL